MTTNKATPGTGFSQSGSRGRARTAGNNHTTFFPLPFFLFSSEDQEELAQRKESIIETIDRALQIVGTVEDEVPSYPFVRQDDARKRREIEDNKEEQRVPRKRRYRKS